MSLLNCCFTARLKSNIEAWLIAQTEIQHFWVMRMRLYRCPSCGQFWLWRAELVGHQEWDLKWMKCASLEDFEVVCRTQLAEDERRKEQQKRLFEENGLEWPSGLKRR